MAIAVPDAVITEYDHVIDRLDLPDSDDRHVLAAAISAGASLVTANLSDFPQSSVPSGVTVLAPADFVLGLIHADLDAVTVVEEQAATLRNPPMTAAELLEGLAVVGLRKSVRRFAARRDDGADQALPPSTNAATAVAASESAFAMRCPYLS